MSFLVWHRRGRDRQFDLVPRRPKGLIVLVFFLALLPYCAEEDDSPRTEKITPPKFHSRDNTGVWPEKMAAGHLPRVEYRAGRSEVIVYLDKFDFKLKPRHFVEAVVLLNKDNREVLAHHLKPGKRFQQVRFDLSKDTRYRPIPPFSVVLKCNQHGMWKVPVK